MSGCKKLLKYCPFCVENAKWKIFGVGYIRTLYPLQDATKPKVRWIIIFDVRSLPWHHVYVISRNPLFWWRWAGFEPASLDFLSLDFIRFNARRFLQKMFARLTYVKYFRNFFSGFTFRTKHVSFCRSNDLTGSDIFCTILTCSDIFRNTLGRVITLFNKLNLLTPQADITTFGSFQLIPNPPIIILIYNSSCKWNSSQIVVGN